MCWQECISTLRVRRVARRASGGRRSAGMLTLSVEMALSRVKGTGRICISALPSLLRGIGLPAAVKTFGELQKGIVCLITSQLWGTSGRIVGIDNEPVCEGAVWHCWCYCWLKTSLQAREHMNRYRAHVKVSQQLRKCKGLSLLFMLKDSSACQW